ncbi:MAG: sigma-70 family RNA polymerase sigma factor [Anaerolineales bacterium]|nr:sigma-70 family RNA polymerase sigma factor [Anaerolineales bacterium]
MNERALLEALRARDPNALTILFERHADSIYRLALRLLNDEAMADGVVQDTFIAVIEHIDGFEGRATISTWLYRVAYNNAMGRLRKARPHLDLDEATAGYCIPEAFIDWETIPERTLSSTEVKAELDRAINALNPNLRAVFLLRDVEELSTEATAHVLGISEGAVKVRLHRARLALREQLAGYFMENIEEL